MENPAKIWLDQSKAQTMAEETTSSVESTVREIRRRTRKKYSAEEIVRIVLEGMRGEEKIAELCRQEDIHQNMP